MPGPEFQLSTHFFPWIPCNPASVLALFFLRDVFSTLPKLLIFRMRILPFSLLTWYFFFVLSLWLSKVFLYVSFPGSFPVFCCAAHSHIGVTVPSGLKSHALVSDCLPNSDPSASLANLNLCHLPLGAARDPTPATLTVKQRRSSIKHTERQTPNGKDTEQRREEGKLRIISQSKATRRAGQNSVKSSKTEINLQREKKGQDAVMAFIKREGARS